MTSVSKSMDCYFTAIPISKFASWLRIVTYVHAIPMSLVRTSGLQINELINKLHVHDCFSISSMLLLLPPESRHLLTMNMYCIQDFQ